MNRLFKKPGHCGCKFPRLRLPILVTLTFFLCSLSCSAGSISYGDVLKLQRFKQYLYNNVTLFNADEVAAGRADPFIYVEVDGTVLPVSQYHFRVKTGAESALAAAIDLPYYLSLAPIRIVKGTSPQYFISIIVYKAGGERNGLICEWMTYVMVEGDKRPRILMLDVAGSQPLLNPVELHAQPAQEFVYGKNGNVLTTDISSGTLAFSADVNIPSPPSRERLLDRRYGAAGDIVFWRNGIADLQFFNGLIANRHVINVPPTAVSVDDSSPWAAFAEAEPKWVFLYDGRIDVAIRPWVNADDPEVPLDSDFREEILGTKATAFSALERNRGAAVKEGTAEPMADFLLESFPPAIFINFRVPPAHLAEFAKSIPLPEGFCLSRIEPYPGAGNHYFLNLNVYQAAGLAPGLRAEWSVYAKKRGDPAPRFMIVEAQTSVWSIDPVDVITRAADVFRYELVGDVLIIDIRSGDLSFLAALLLPDQPERREMNLQWAECNNLVYWRNGVADKIYYNESAYGQVALIPNRRVFVKDDTRFADYVELHHVFIYEDAQDFVASPWNNLNELERATSPRALRKRLLAARLAQRQRRRGKAGELAGHLRRAQSLLDEHRDDRDIRELLHLRSVHPR